MNTETHIGTSKISPFPFLTLQDLALKQEKFVLNLFFL
jgi:hypothetical protein